jgi:signal transduction histidine kinase
MQLATLASRPKQEILMVKVLIIEDSAVQVSVIEGLLAQAKDSDFELASKNTVEDGIAFLSESDVDAILLDLNLPDCSGIDSFRRVREAAPSVPVVILSSTDDEATIVQAQEQGAEDYLVKGEIGCDILARSIRYSIARKNAEISLKQANDELEQRVEARTQDLRAMQDEAVVRQQELAHAERLNTLGEMAAGLAHELNQPLMAIIGFTDHCIHSIETGKSEPEQLTRTLQDTSREAKRAGEIIKRMRRLVSKRTPVRETVEINDIVNESVDLIRPGLDVQIKMELGEALPTAKVDRVQMQQVILNLAQNAVQAMKDSDCESCELTLRTDTTEKELIVEVADNGPGLPQETLERLFDPFFTRNKPEGLGLGLSITRNIVESHGGELTVKSNDTQGLTFRFTIPVLA